MPTTWPASLPQSPLISGYEEGKADGRRISSTDTGPGKMYRRTSALGQPLTFQMLLTSAQLDTFITFFESTIDEGALPFDFPNPRGVGNILVRFRQGAPTWSSPNGGIHYLLSIQLEVLP